MKDWILNCSQVSLIWQLMFITLALEDHLFYNETSDWSVQVQASDKGIELCVIDVTWFS